MSKRMRDLDQNIADLISLSPEALDEFGREMARKSRRHSVESRPERCERCGDHLPGAVIFGSGRWCECGKLANAARRAIERIDPAGEMTFEALKDLDPSAAKARDALQQIASGERERGAFLFGSPGRGKTHLSIALARRVLDRGGLCGVFSLAGLVSQIQETYGFSDVDESKAQIIEGVCRHDVVILDDIGKEHTSPDVESIVYQLVDGIYSARRTLIASSNLPGGDFVERYDGAVLSRLGGMCEKIVIRGDDRRKAAWAW